MNAVFTVRDAAWETDMRELQQVRRAVFIVEQNVPEALEWDEADAGCLHAIALDAGGRPIATGRLLADGHVGRIAVLAEWRGRGVGAAIFEHLLVAATRLGHRELLLNAQTHAIGFYARYGFVPCGEEFMEAGLAHRPMRFQPVPGGVPSRPMRAGIPPGSRKMRGARRRPVRREDRMSAR